MKPAIVINLKSEVDYSVQDRIGRIVKLDELRQRLAFMVGMNIMGPGHPLESLSAYKEKLSEALRDSESAINQLILAGELQEEARLQTDQEKENLLRQKAIELGQRESVLRLNETIRLEELGATRVRVHFSEGPQNINHIVDGEGNIKENPDLGKFVEFYEELTRKGKLVELVLGPGLPKYQLTDGTVRENSCQLLKSQDGLDKVVTALTEFHIPTDEQELEIWARYCKLMAEKFPKAEFTIWVEPNHNLDDQGYGRGEDPMYCGSFTATGRNPKEYARAILAAARAVKEAGGKNKIGVNVCFVDTDYLMKTFDEIASLYKKPNEVINYITINPYRDTPELAGPIWNEERESRRAKAGANGIPPGRFDWGTTNTYQNEILTLYEVLSQKGITTDIRIGELGWRADELGEHRKAIFNLRGWILDRFLWLPETPWRLTDRKGSVGGMGFIKDGTPTESYWAYRNLNKILGPDVIPLGELVCSDDQVYGRVFTNVSTKEKITVIWKAGKYEDNEKPGVTLEGIQGPAEIISGLTKESIQTEEISESRIKLKITGEPIIVRQRLSSTETSVEASKKEQKNWKFN